MFIKKEYVVKVILSLILLIYFVATAQYNTMFIDATLTLLFASLLLIKYKDHTLLFIISIFFFYCVYSIVIGEYYFKDLVGVPMQEVNTVEIYTLAIGMMLIFFFLLYLFTPKIYDDKKSLPYKKNSTMFYILCFILVLIGIFGISDGQNSSYTVSISPIYEYSVILFVFLYYSTGNNIIKKILASVLLLVFVFQDYYTGGRITSLQLIIVFVYFMFANKLKSRNIVIGAILGIIINSVVGAYRIDYSLKSFSIITIINNILDNLFVFDTVTYSYYASATHIASVDNGLVPFGTRIQSLITFFTSIFVGGDDVLGQVTTYVDANYFSNIGGGIFLTHFYFWLGWLGVIISGLIICLYLKKNLNSNSDFSKLSLIIFVVTSPRWFLYNPLILFRAQFIFTILFLLYKIGYKLTSTKKLDSNIHSLKFDSDYIK